MEDGGWRMEDWRLEDWGKLKPEKALKHGEISTLWAGLRDTGICMPGHTGESMVNVTRLENIHSCPQCWPDPGPVGGQVVAFTARKLQSITQPGRLVV